jgi:hypothetical protein
MSQPSFFEGSADCAVEEGFGHGGIGATGSVHGFSVIRGLGCVDSRIFLFLLVYRKLRGWVGETRGVVGGY